LSAALIVLTLLGLAAVVGWWQWRTLRRLPERTGLPGDERRHLRAQAWRRLVNSALMVVLAGALVATYWLGQERRAGELARQGAASESGAPPSLDAAQSQILRQYLAFWGVFALLLLAMLGVALADLWAIQRFARRSLRQMQADRRAMIEEQAAEFRRQRGAR
jgi:hypothetical protein